MKPSREKDKKKSLIYEDYDIIAFKDAHPVAPIHYLVIPKKHISSANDIKDEDIEKFRCLCFPSEYPYISSAFIEPRSIGIYLERRFLLFSVVCLFNEPGTLFKNESECL